MEINPGTLSPKQDLLFRYLELIIQGNEVIISHLETIQLRLDTQEIKIELLKRAKTEDQL